MFNMPMFVSRRQVFAYFADAYFLIRLRNVFLMRRDWLYNLVMKY